MYARAIKRVTVENLNLALGPLIAAQGHKWKGYKIEGDADKDAISAAKDPGTAADAMAAHGFAIRDEAAPPPASPEPGEAPDG